MRGSRDDGRDLRDALAGEDMDDHFLESVKRVVFEGAVATGEAR